MIEAFSLSDWTIYALVALLAGFVHGSIGLGFPMLSTAILSTIIDLRLAILITLLPTITVNVMSMSKGGNWRFSIGKYWPLALWCLLGSIIGANVIVFHNPTPYKLLLAFLIFLYLFLERAKGSMLKLVTKHPRSANVGFGLTAGFLAGSTNTMVPLLVIYSLEAGWTKTVMVQVFNMCFFSGKAAQLAVFSTAGLFNWQVALFTLALALVAALSLVAGHRLHDKINIDLFRQIIKAVLLILGIILVAQVFFSVDGLNFSKYLT